MDKTEQNIHLVKQITELQSRVSELEQVIHDQCERIILFEQDEKKYKVLLDGSSDPIFSFSNDGKYQYVNYAFAEGVNKPLEKIIHHKIWDVFSKDEADKRYAIVKLVFETGETKTIEVRVPREDEDRYYLTTAKPIFDSDGRIILVICISKEITERKRLEKELLRLSNYDSLTGLYNRHYFEVELERMQVCRLFPVSIIVSDMDRLKVINDHYGHATGDKYIQKIAMIIQDSIRPGDIAARTGGDEITILLPETDAAAASEIIQNIRSNVQKVNDENLHLSVGSNTGEIGSNLMDVFRLADESMYLHKRNGNKEI